VQARLLAQETYDGTLSPRELHEIGDGAFGDGRPRCFFY